jgi:hypothetical protein
MFGLVDSEAARVWGMASLQPIATVTEAPAVALSPDGEALATGERDGGVRLWKIT